MRQACCIIVGLMLLGGCPLRAEILYAVTDLGTLGGSFTTGSAINNTGQVTGSSATSDGIREAFLYSNGQITDLGNLGAIGRGGSASGAAGINDRGDAVGSAVPRFPLGVLTHAVLYRNGQVIDLGAFGGFSSSAAAINNSGQVVGSYANITFTVSHAFLYSDGQTTDLGTLGGSSSFASDVNNRGQVVGTSSLSTTDFTQHAFLYTNGQMIDVGALGGTNSSASGINDNGQVVGSSDTSTGVTHAFLYAGGEITDLGTLPGRPDSYASGMNDRAQVVGYSSGRTSDQPGRAFLYSNGQMLDLNEVIDPSLGVTLSQATGINNNGQIVANGSTSSSLSRAFLLTPVPEPSTVALFGLALLGFAGLGCRYRSSRG